MDGITAKLGPLPVWAWAALAVGGFVVLRLRKKPAPTNQLYGGELGPDNAPGYPGNFALNPGSLAPSSAMPVTNAQISTPDPGSAPPDTGGGSGGSTVANAPQAGVDPFTNNLLGGTGLVSSGGVPPGGKLPR